MNKTPHSRATVLPRIVLVDDEPSTLRSLERFFRTKGHHVLTAENAEQGIELIQNNPLIQLVISDYKMPGSNGIMFLNEVARIKPDIRRVILSAFDDSPILLAAMNEQGVHRYLVKPWDSKELMTVVEEQLAEHQRIVKERLHVAELAGKHHMLVMNNQQLDTLIAERTAELMQRKHELQVANEQLRLLTGHIETSREDERRAIAREIHDDLAQALTAIQLTIAPHLLNSAESSATALLHKVKSQVDGVITSVQHILSNLRPQVLEELGLEAALDWLAKDIPQRFGMTGSFTHSLRNRTVSAKVAICLYRITQESLTNAGRHAHATEVAIRLWSEQDAIHLEVQDDGIGLLAENRVKTGSFGIIGMQERATLCGGNCTVSRLPERGTLVAVSVPLSSEELIP